MYRVRQPQVTSSIVDGEAVIINLDTGNYYSTDGIGAEIWSRISRHQPVAEIVEIMQSRFSDPEGLSRIAKTIRHFVGVLESENLIESVADAVKATPPVELHTADEQAYTEPVLYRYDDMNELLLLDPIHDVDESGWPKTPNSVEEDERTVSS